MHSLQWARKHFACAVREKREKENLANRNQSVQKKIKGMCMSKMVRREKKLIYVN